MNIQSGIFNIKNGKFNFENGKSYIQTDELNIENDRSSVLDGIPEIVYRTNYNKPCPVYSTLFKKNICPSYTGPSGSVRLPKRS